jgi:uncharacterized FlaG/YvyC family protein
VLYSFKDLCGDNNLEEPTYVSISDVGPPHARIFTIRCKVSNFTEDGIATTKKQAKHEAAKKMIDKIQELVNGLNPVKQEKCVGTETANTENADDELEKLYLKRRKINLGIKISDYHVKWKNSMTNDKREKILKDLNSIFPEDSQSGENITNELITDMFSKLQNLLSDINITIKMKNSSLNKSRFIKIVELDTCPVITHIGVGETEVYASWQALSQMISSIKLLLS